MNEGLLQQIPEGVRVLREPEARQRYEVPERGAPGHTPAVLVPRTESDLAALLAWANANRVPLVINAGRTGLVEAQRPDGECVLSLERLNRLLSLNLADGRVLALDPEAGAAADQWRAQWDALGRPQLAGATVTAESAVTIDALNEALAPLGLMFPMEMGSSAAATLGGCAANASAGSNAICYGTGAHMVVEASGLWGDGTPAGPCHARAWAPADESRLAIDSATVHPDWGLLGSQGIFGIITRLTLRTYPVPAQREALMLPADSVATAVRMMAATRAEFGSALEECEFMSDDCVQLVLQTRGESVRLPYPEPLTTPWHVLMQVSSTDPDEDLAGRLYAFVAETLEIPDEKIGYAPLPALKAIRHAITECSNHRMRERGGGRLSFDTAAPLSRFGDYLDALDQMVRTQAPEASVLLFGHAGVGGVHLHVIGNQAYPVKAYSATLVPAVIELTVQHEGTFSAEHGIGPKWADEFLKRAEPAMVEQLVQLKQRHDPRAVLQPRSFGLGRLLAGG